MGLRGKVIDLIAEYLCGTSWLQSRHENRMRHEQSHAARYAHRQKVAQRVNTMPRNKPEARPPVRGWEKPQQEHPDDEEAKPAQIGLRIPSSAQQWGEDTGALLDECPRDSAMPAKLQPVKKITAQYRVIPKPKPIPKPSMDAMSPSTVREVIGIIGRLFEHVPYAISGQAAMVYYGSQRHASTHVSILVPQASQHVARVWALAQGMHAVPFKSDCFAVSTRDGLLRMVRIKLVKDSSFESVRTTRAGRSHARIITLPGLANQVASAYIADLKSGAPVSRQSGYARDMRWVLRRIADIRLHEHWLTPARVPDVLKREFWLPFTMSFPEIVALFEVAGLEVSDEVGVLGNRNYAGNVSQKRGGTMLGGFYAH
ncbi:hypothetical protein LIA77_05977 [Sarocladium implicatum]|nr:hypothetical protein LIA77_05977 [Sarocladium implicatum]